MTKNKKTLNQNDAMALAYYGYPEGKEKLEALKAAEAQGINLPNKERPTFNMPDGWDFMKQDVLDSLGLEKGYNQAPNNQFELLINPDTKEIVISFKGSVEGSNWASDFLNTGGREFKKIMAQADAAIEALRKHPDYQDYNISAAGHSLGGGMAQAFALKHNIDASVYNSLPISSFIAYQTDYFNTETKQGYHAYLERLDTYKETDHRVHDVRTANDIASQYFFYRSIAPYSGASFIGSSEVTGYLTNDPTVLPGTKMPALLQVGTLPLSALISGVDHTMGSLRDATHGLAIDEETGRYNVPKGHTNIAALHLSTKLVLSQMDNSHILKVSMNEGINQNTITIVRENATQIIDVEKNGKTTLKESKNGEITEMNYYPSQVLKALENNKEIPITFTQGDSFLIKNRQESFQSKIVSSAPASREYSLEIDKNNLPEISDGRDKLNAYTASIALNIAGVTENNLINISIQKDRVGDRDLHRNVYDLQYDNGINQRIIEFPNDRNSAIINQQGVNGEELRVNNIIPSGIEKSLKKDQTYEIKYESKVDGISRGESTLKISSLSPEIEQETLQVSSKAQSDLEAFFNTDMNDFDAVMAAMNVFVESPTGQNIENQMMTERNTVIAQQEMQERINTVENNQPEKNNRYSIS